MTYSCSDFVDTILDALKIDVPEESQDVPSDQADLVLAAIEQLRTTRQKARQVVSELLEWAAQTGGWEATCWERAREFRDSLPIEDNSASAAPDAKTKPRVLIDISGGVVQGTFSDTPVELIFLDYEDGENVRANIPQSNGSMVAAWATYEEAEVKPEVVDRVFTGTEWLEDAEEG